MAEVINNELLSIINDGEGVTTEFKKAQNKLLNNLYLDISLKGIKLFPYDLDISVDVTNWNKHKI